MSQLFDGLGPNGKLMVIGATFDPIEVTPVQLIGGSRTIQGWAAGIPADSEDTLRFAELSGVRPMIETYPFEKASEACARMMSGRAQFRVDTVCRALYDRIKRDNFRFSEKDRRVGRSSRRGSLPG